MNRQPRLPFYIVMGWFVSVIGWWMFAFFPMPSEPPAWLSAAREACFGNMQSGLPDAGGWMLLVLAPASFLIGIFILWGHQLQDSFRYSLSRSSGRLVVLLVATIVMFEGSWVFKKIEAARAISNLPADLRAEKLDDNYPIGTQAAFDFRLTSDTGATLALSQFKGRPALITFAFAHCQSLCPTLIITAKEALKEFPDVPFFVITLDPWRDTPSVLDSLKRTWQLDERTHILSSKKPEDVVTVINKYQVPFDRNKETGDVVHPGLVFIVDQEGRLAYTFNSPPSSWISEALRRINARGVSNVAAQSSTQSL